ncbi:MAG: hypothetical protein R6T98_14070 [Desulfatiglandales bacterium]
MVAWPDPRRPEENQKKKLCCGTPNGVTAADIALALGYSGVDMTAMPEGANMGLGCGNPQAIASLQPGEVVLNLGSGGGFDCFLAARAVGDKRKYEFSLNPKINLLF